MIKMVCLGDSITEGEDIEKGFRWTSLAANALGLEILNCGIGGDTTQGMLARFYPEVVSRKPAFVLILGGTNDLWWGAEINTILGNIFSIVCQARHHDITPIIGLPLPIHLPFVQQQGMHRRWAAMGNFWPNSITWWHVWCRPQPTARFRWSILTVIFSWQTGRPTPVCF